MKYQSVVLTFFALVFFSSIMLAQDNEETFIVYRDIDSNLYSISSHEQTIIPITSYEQSPIDQPRINERVTRYDISALGIIVFVDRTDRAIYSVPIEGGEVTQLNTVPILSDRYYISADGSWLVFFGIDENREEAIFSVPVEGGTNTNLSMDLDVGSEINPYSLNTFLRITSDNRFIVFTGRTGRGVQNAYVTPIEGGTPMQLNGRLASGGNVEALEITADGSTVIYAADQEADGVFNLYTVSITGGETVNMTPDTPASPADTFGNIWTISFFQYPFTDYILINTYEGFIVIDPTANEVVLRYAAFSITGRSDLTAFNQLIYSHGSLYAIDLSSDIMEEPPVVFGDTRNHILSPDGTSAISVGSELAFVDLQNGDTQIIPTNGLVNVVFSGCSNTDRLVAVSPNNEYVVYVSPDENGNYNYLSYSASDGGEPTHLNKFPGTRTFTPYLFRITDDSRAVVYINDEEFAGFADLYLASIDGSATVRLTDDNSRRLLDFKLYPQGTQWCFDQ